MWLAHAKARGPLQLVNPSTRRAAYGELAGLAEQAASRGRRLLVGVDFSLGFPAGLAELLGLRAPPARWQAVWEHLAARVVDGPRNENNRFEVADALNRASGYRLFWGRPAGPRFASLTALPAVDVLPPGLAPNPLSRYRATELAAPRRPKATWQLFGRGSVGGQTLTGIPYLVELRRLLGPRLAVWPMETGWGVPGPLDEVAVVVAEVWPSLLGPPRCPGEVRDAGQVEAVLRWLRGLEVEAWRRLLSPAHDGHGPLFAEEGWILGVR